MVYCDGAVRLLAYDIDPEIHLRSAHRKDWDDPIETLDY
jgi:hypothetical protein